RELGVVRLHEHAALGRPVPLERADHLLEVHGAEPNGVSATTAAGGEPATRPACGGGSPRGTRRTPWWRRGARGLPVPSIPRRRPQRAVAGADLRFRAAPRATAAALR